MKNFFTVIILIAVGILLFILYYTGKSFYHRYKEIRTREKIKKKHYEDEKYYTRNFLRVRLKELETGSIRWLQIYSRNYPEQKIEIIYDSIKGDIQIQNRWESIITEEINTIRELGITDHNTKGDLHCFYAPMNAKIVADVIYYIMEKIYSQKYAQNLKFVTSGGY